MKPILGNKLVVTGDREQGKMRHISCTGDWDIKRTHTFCFLISFPLLSFLVVFFSSYHSFFVLLFFGSYMAPCTRRSKAIKITDNMQLDNTQLTIADNRASLEAATQKDAGNIQHQCQTIGMTTGTMANLKGKSQLSQIRPI